MKKVHVFMIIAALFVLSSCQNGEIIQSGKGFIGGTEGLVFSFAPESPPETVLDGGQFPFDVILQIKNSGEDNVDAGDVWVTLTGISYEILGINEGTLHNQNIIPKGWLDETTAEIHEGGIDEIGYYGLNYARDIAYDTDLPIAVNYCYKYKTEAISDVCLTQKPIARVRDTDVCQVDGIKVVGNSAGPVQVVDVSERKSGINQITVTLKVQNVGNGDVYPISYTSESSCEHRDDKINRLNVNVISGLQTISLSCPKLGGGTSGELRLIDNQATLQCQIDTSRFPQTSPIKDDLEFTLDYVYKDIVSTKVRVENAV